eukprot:875385_1
MAYLLDALDIAAITKTILSCSKDQLLRFVSSMDVSDLRYFVLSLLCQLQHNHSTPQTIRFVNHTKACFSKRVRVSNDLPNDNNPFTSLPSSIGACIISFSNMYDRLTYQRISKDLYAFCQIPMARYHLIIDHKFVKQLYSNSININKYFHCRYVEIQYVFKDKTHEHFEQKYYSLISIIIQKSPLLHTLKYQLQYRQFRSRLNHVTPCDWWYGYTGHILEWMHLLQLNTNPNARHTLFHSIKKLIYIPSICKDGERKNLKWRDQYDLFGTMLPNVVSISLPIARRYSNSCNQSDFEWKIFKANRYNQRLTEIECNLDMPYIKWQIRDFCIKLHVHHHPLYCLDTFSALRTLKLTLPMYQMNNELYYKHLLSPGTRTVCTQLQDVSLEFTKQHPSISALNVMDKICAYVLSHAPNITSYKLITNTVDEYKYKHLIGFYDRIQTLETDTPSIIPCSARMLSLKQLVLRIYHSNYESVDISSIRKDLNGLPHLESLQCVYIRRQNRYAYDKYRYLHDNIQQFMNYVSKQKVTLKYIRLEHKTRVKSRYVEYNQCIPSKPRSNRFGVKNFTKHKSLELCKSIVEWTNAKHNSDVKSVVFNPAIFKRKELEYLYFWFENGNGRALASNYSIKSANVLTDFCAIQFPI